HSVQAFMEIRRGHAQRLAEQVVGVVVGVAQRRRQVVRRGKVGQGAVGAGIGRRGPVPDQRLQRTAAQALARGNGVLVGVVHLVVVGGGEMRQFAAGALAA